MLVGSKPSVGEYILSGSLNQISLTPTNEIKLLGINIDCHLNWKNHIKLHCKSISPKVGLLHRLSDFPVLTMPLLFGVHDTKHISLIYNVFKIDVHAYVHVPIILFMTFLNNFTQMDEYPNSVYLLHWNFYVKICE